MDPRRGYTLAVLNMVISGIAIYVNSLGVKMFADSTLYTALKNAVVGLVLLVPLAVSRENRSRYARLTVTEWLLLLLVALIGGSLSYALYFRGLQLSTPVTASLIDHTQFLFVAVFAALFLRERFGPAVWAALVILLAGLTLGITVSAVRVDAGVIFITAATLLFAADFVLMKHLLRSVAPLTVMTFKMGFGSLLLIGYVAASGRAGDGERAVAPAVGVPAGDGAHPSGLHRHVGSRAPIRVRHGDHRNSGGLADHHDRARPGLRAYRGSPGALARIVPHAPCRACHLHPRQPGRAEPRPLRRKGRRVTDGLLLFARYAYAPNRLGYCGSDDHPALFGYLTEGRADQGLAQLAQRFEGAYPYLLLIARANRLDDPFDRRVVEAYWIGNALLERVGPVSFFDSLKERFQPRMKAQDFSWMTSILPSGAKPHHNFHVFDVYRRAGLLRDQRAAVALERMDQCRISWGRVLFADGADVVVERSPLVLRDGKLTLGAPVTVRVLRHIDGRGYLDDFVPGETVSIHWNWACDRIAGPALHQLVRATRRAIAHTNLTL